MLVESRASPPGRGESEDVYRPALEIIANFDIGGSGVD